MFEEFGIELPLITQLVIQFSNLACATSVLFVPFTLVVFAGIEVGIYLMPSSPRKTLINIAYWSLLVLVIGLLGMSLFMPCLSIISGLA